jgi:hypothetical protein
MASNASHQYLSLQPLDLVQLPQLMELTAGRPDIVVGLIDGPIVIGHSDLAGDNIREVQGAERGTCAKAERR